MTNILPPWLAATETMNAWPEMLGIVHGFWTKNVCGAWEAETKAGGSLSSLVYIMSKGGHNKVIRGIWGQTTSPAESFSDFVIDGSLRTSDTVLPLPGKPRAGALIMGHLSPAASHTSHGLKNFR